MEKDYNIATNISSIHISMSVTPDLDIKTEKLIATKTIKLILIYKIAYH